MELIGSKLDVYNIAPKESYMYAMILPNGHYLRHIVIVGDGLIGVWDIFLIMILISNFLIIYSLLIRCLAISPKEL
jgi:hypothetical protein